MLHGVAAAALRYDARKRRAELGSGEVALLVGFCSLCVDWGF